MNMLLIPSKLKSLLINIKHSYRKIIQSSILPFLFFQNLICFGLPINCDV